MTPPVQPIQPRIDALTGRAREALAVVGLLGAAPFFPHAAAWGLGVRPEAAGRALDELVEAGLLRRLGDRYEAAGAGAHACAREQAEAWQPAGALARLASIFARRCGCWGSARRAR